MSEKQSVISRRVTVQQENGLHMRPAELVARTAAPFDAKVVLTHNGIQAEATSIFDLIGLIAEQGAEIDLKANGPDAEAAAEAIAKLFENNFETGAE